MNQYISDWSGAMGDTFAPLSAEDDGLIELMWCNGHVVMQSQAAPRKPPRPDKAAAAVKDDDADAAAQAWFTQYPVEEDPLERDDLFSELFGEAQATVDGACCKEEAAEERGADEEAARQSSGMMPPPPRPLHAHEPREEKACPGPGDGAAARTSAAACCEATGTATGTEGAESSMLTIGSSFCGSNHVQTTTPRARGAATPPGTGKDVARARDAATDTSSATRFRSCTTKSEQPGPGATSAAAAAHRSGKRKQSDATDAEYVEFESADVACEPAAQRTTTAKRRRAAEVHNLSERRRRDRINEKMKALQELIPYCNKTDKASMLDEAIEYLKSLQLQLQMMWMGGGMAAAAAAAAPVVFPAGVHQYMQRMVAAGPPAHHVASMPPGMPFMAPPPAMQGPPLPDLYARYLAVDNPLPPPMVAPSPYTVQQHCLQGTTMGFYQRQNPALSLPPIASPAPPPPSDGILHRKYENCGKPEIQSMTG